MNRIVFIVFGMTCWMLASTVWATGMNECKLLQGKGANSTSDLPPYQVVLKLFDCAGMTQDVAALDALDRDMMIGRARSLPLDELREKETFTEHPRKYSELTPASRLAKLKRLVDAYYKP